MNAAMKCILHPDHECKPDAAGACVCHPPGTDADEWDRMTPWERGQHLPPDSAAIQYIVRLRNCESSEGKHL